MWVGVRRLKRPNVSGRAALILEVVEYFFADRLPMIQRDAD